MYYRVMIYGIAILPALFIAVRGNCVERCEPINSNSRGNARISFEDAEALARCYSICAVAQV